jgi:hypoxanthine phosphoribosyltransferase
MLTVKVKDKEFEISIPASEIDIAIQKIADQINVDYVDKNPVFLVILNGSFMFAADLVRKVRIPCEVSFVKYSSYEGTKSTGNLKDLIGLNEDVRGRHLIIVEDIVDTGLTLDKILEKLKFFEPADIRLACFCFKPDAFEKSFKIDYLGMEIPNDFIVGYGLDYDGYGRNLPDIYKILES